MKAIFLNGPPGSGKDHAARHLYDRGLLDGTVLFDRFSMPHKRAFAGLMKLPVDTFGIVEPWESRKEEIIPELHTTYRQWQIDFSERFMKPLYGEDIFARLLVSRIGHRLDRDDYLLVVPDCGFKIEVDAAIPCIGKDNVHLVRLHRHGYDYSRDSRSYVKRSDGGIETDLWNYGTAEFERDLTTLVQDWLKRR